MLNKWEYVNKPVRMPVKILMSGPIRPTPEDVRNTLIHVKTQFPGAEVYLCTWKGQLTPEIERMVDFAYEIPEPTEAEIDSIVSAKTIQQRQLAPRIDHWTYSMHRMIHGVKSLCEFASSTIDTNDIVVRIRTDTPFLFDPDYLKSILDSVGNEYIIQNRKTGGVGFDDWFAITRFKILRESWTFNDYNTSVSAAWNAEDLVRRNVRVPIRFLDSSKFDCYINRPDSQKLRHEKV